MTTIGPTTKLGRVKISSYDRKRWVFVCDHCCPGNSGESVFKYQTAELAHGALVQHCRTRHLVLSP